EGAAQLVFEALPHRRDPGEDALAQPLLHCQSARAGRGVAEVGIAVLEEAAALDDGFVDRLADHHGADRLIPGAEALRDRDDVRYHAFALERPHRAAATHAAHHLVEDEEHAMPVADLAHAPEVAGHGRYAADRCTGDRLGDERDHLAGAQALDLALELDAEPVDIRRIGLACALLAIGIARRDMGRLDEQRLELLAAGEVAA